MFYYQNLKKLIIDTLYLLKNDKRFVDEILNKNPFTIEIPNEKKFGDVSTNVAMKYSNFFDLKPIILAEKIKEKLIDEIIISKVEVIRPGFINVFFKDTYWHEQLRLIHENKIKKKSNRKKIHIEYVSANPTGLMHIGHARGAILGDAIASLLQNAGHDIKKEYYINDAGNQIDILTKTIIFHVENLKNKKQKIINEEYYPGDYLKNLSQIIYKLKPKLFQSSINQSSFKKISEIGVKLIIDDIKKDLKKIGVFHDSFVSEKNLITKKKISEITILLKNKNLLYEGFQEKPKGISSSNWKKEKQILFKSTKFDDDSDRALIKSDGTLTYFMSDIIYHQLKISQNYDVLLNIWGIDHSGYVSRLKNAVMSIVNKKFDFQIKLTSLVNLIKNNKPLKMSKRKGVFISMREVIDEVGKDALRFTMISRSPEKVIDFDFDLVKSKSKENPVFYVQYAYARCCSIEKIFHNHLKFSMNKINLRKLKLPEELNLIKALSTFEKILEQSTQNFEPHRLANYLYETSKIFHNYWSLGKVDSENKILNLEKVELSKSRFFLILAVKKIIKKGLVILNISAPKEM